MDIYLPLIWWDDASPPFKDVHKLTLVVKLTALIDFVKYWLHTTNKPKCPDSTALEVTHLNSSYAFVGTHSDTRTRRQPVTILRIPNLRTNHPQGSVHAAVPRHNAVCSRQDPAVVEHHTTTLKYFILSDYEHDLPRPGTTCCLLTVDDVWTNISDVWWTTTTCYNTTSNHTEHLSMTCHGTTEQNQTELLI